MVNLLVISCNLIGISNDKFAYAWVLGQLVNLDGPFFVLVLHGSMIQTQITIL